MNLRTQSLIRDFRRFVSAHPALYFPIAGLAGNGQLLSGKTDLVIEGYPRSANSFTEAAFLHSQSDRPIQLATHSHAAAQVMRAIARDIPVLVLIRHPDQAVASINAMSHAQSLGQHFRDYIAFHRPLVDLREKIVTAEFSQVIARFDDVVRAVNDKYGIGLSIPVLNDDFDAGVARARDLVSSERVGRLPNYSSAQGDAALKSRRIDQDATIAALEAGADPALVPLRNEAIALFDQFARTAEVA